VHLPSKLDLPPFNYPGSQSVVHCVCTANKYEDIGQHTLPSMFGLLKLNTLWNLYFEKLLSKVNFPMCAVCF